MNSMVNEVIASFNEYVSKIPAGCDYIEGELRIDNVYPALIAIQEFASGMEWLIEATDLLIQNGIVVEQNFKGINELLLEINEAITNEDFYLVADLFKYEIKPLFENLTLIQINLE